ncbi:MAG: hypothetical protein L3J05_09550 [Robiginitomaculum sp.]|nr:hypothetical protein [Robiginitomaculum sp.]
MASFSPVLEETIHRALTLAADRQHELATLEHLLLALIDDKDANAVLTACDIELESLRGALTSYLDEDLASLVVEELTSRAAWNCAAAGEIPAISRAAAVPKKATFFIICSPTGCCRSFTMSALP